MHLPESYGEDGGKRGGLEAGLRSSQTFHQQSLTRRRIFVMNETFSKTAIITIIMQLVQIHVVLLPKPRHCTFFVSTYHDFHFLQHTNIGLIFAAFI